MANQILLPHLSWNEKSAKGTIIGVLANEWPLSTKEVFNRLKKRHSFSVSYQAVHKALNELEKAEIIKKENKKYSLHRKWIENIKFFAKDLDSKYKNNTKATPYSEGTITLTFDSIANLGRFIIYDYLHGDYNPKGKDCVCLWNHCWPLIGLSDQDHQKIVDALDIATHYSITKQNTYLDDLFTESLNKIGKKCKTGIDYFGLGDYIIEGDYVLQTIYTPKFAKYWNKVYKTTNKETMDIAKMFKLYNKKTEITVVIFKNQQFADKLRQETLKHFSEGSK